MFKNNFFFNFLQHGKNIFKYNRSLSGDGVRKTFKYFQTKINNQFKIKYFKSGQKYFDWIAPKEWKVNNAYLKYKNKIILNYKENNLSLLGYSSKKIKKMTLNELKKNIFYNKDRPNSTPYVTSYYYKNWGFCLPYNKFKKLKKGMYDVNINTEFFNGKINYAELYIKGRSKKEILITSYTCHPSLANNELSGPLVIAGLASKLKPSKYSIRLLLIPETIGAIAYISKNLAHLQKNLIAGVNLTCVGKNGPFTIIKTINENTYIDKIIYRIANRRKLRLLSFLERGSNERQFGCQKLNLPFLTFCRMKFGEYPEYHTSDDNLKIINNKTLMGSMNFIKDIINEIQKNSIYIKNNYCEPFLSKYNLWEKIRHKKFGKKTRDIFNITAYVNKDHDITELSAKLKIPKKDN